MRGEENAELRPQRRIKLHRVEVIVDVAEHLLHLGNRRIKRSPQGGAEAIDEHLDRIAQPFAHDARPVQVPIIVAIAHGGLLQLVE